MEASPGQRYRMVVGECRMMEHTTSHLTGLDNVYVEEDDTNVELISLNA